MVKEFFFFIINMQLMIWQKPLITMRWTAIMEDWQTSFPENSLKMPEAKFCRPFQGLYYRQSWRFCTFFWLITKRQWICYILIFSQFIKCIYFQSYGLNLSGKWHWWPSSFHIFSKNEEENCCLMFSGWIHAVKYQ